jgi:hypothetical protein
VVLYPILRCSLSGLLPPAPLKRQVRLVDELADQERSPSTGFGIAAAVDVSNEFVAGLLGLALGQIAGTERLQATFSLGVVVQDYPSLGLPAWYLLEASFLKSASQLKFSC